MTFTLNLMPPIGWLLSTPLGDIVTLLYYFSVSSFLDFLLWLTINLNKKDYEKSIKKLLKRKSKKWNSTIVEDETTVINELFLLLKRGYLRTGISKIWPVLYVIIAEDSWRSHRVLFGIEILSMSFFIVNVYMLRKAEEKIVMSAMKQ